jgi:hypothetical protein
VFADVKRYASFKAGQVDPVLVGKLKTFKRRSCDRAKRHVKTLRMNSRRSGNAL